MKKMSPILGVVLSGINLPSVILLIVNLQIVIVLSAILPSAL